MFLKGCGLDERNRQRLQDAWKKNLAGHRYENRGYTFIRVPTALMVAYNLEQEANAK